VTRSAKPIDDGRCGLIEWRLEAARSARREGAKARRREAAKPRSRDGAKPRWRDAAMARRRDGAMARWRDAAMPRCRDAAMPRCRDAAMPRCRDAAVAGQRNTTCKLPRVQRAMRAGSGLPKIKKISASRSNAVGAVNNCALVALEDTAQLFKARRAITHRDAYVRRLSYRA
jgi:hypothetical protein